MNTTVVLVAALIVVALVGLLWWLLITTEGVYLGRRVVIWLYDLYAKRYDGIKQFHSEYEYWLLANPILTLIDDPAPLVLDVATGTGRLPMALCDHEAFTGRVIGVDLSRKMLDIAAEKLKIDHDRVDLLHCSAEVLPFPDNTFDVVTCLEALEFMTDPAEVLREIVRVLRPDGLLLISQRIHTRLMPGKVWSEDALREQLNALGIINVEFEPWQYDYQRVWGRKYGE